MSLCVIVAVSLYIQRYRIHSHTYTRHIYICYMMAIMTLQLSYPDFPGHDNYITYTFVYHRLYLRTVITSPDRYISVRLRSFMLQPLSFSFAYIMPTSNGAVVRPSPLEPVTGPRCKYRFPTGHRCYGWSVCQCKHCDSNVSPPLVCRPFI